MDEEALANGCLDFAANDVHVIAKRYETMSRTPLCQLSEEKVKEHSERYTNAFRGRSVAVNFLRDIVIVTEEQGIISEEEFQ